MHPFMIQKLTSPRTPKQRMSVSLMVVAILVIAILGAFIGMARAAPADALQEINRYFNSIRTMKGQFVQFGPRGEKTEGQFALQRPGKVRFYYNPPSTLDVIADGKSVAVRDRKMATQDIWPLGRTPLRYLLSNNIDLTRDANVTDVSVGSDVVKVTIRDLSAMGDGTITLMFDAEDYTLKQWNVTDSQGQQTSVSIHNVATGVSVDQSLFNIDYTRILE